MDATPSASFISTSDVLSAIRGGQPPLIVDVRRKPVFRAATDMIAGALWRDPERVAEWAGELPRASRVVAYCVHGHEVSQGVAIALAGRSLFATRGVGTHRHQMHERCRLSRLRGGQVRQPRLRGKLLSDVWPAVAESVHRCDRRTRAGGWLAARSGSSHAACRRAARRRHGWRDRRLGSRAR